MSWEILNAAFRAGVVRPAETPNTELPEIGVLGRSNVGKSSFINMVLGRKLARTSSTPGHTREVNLYDLEAASGGSRQKLVLADLPGFGYAKLSKVERERISRITVEYLRETPQLKVAVLLVDSKRAAEADEHAIQEVCAAGGVHLLVVATKVDRLSQKERTAAMRRIAASLGLEPQDLLVSGEGAQDPRRSFWERVFPLLG